MDINEIREKIKRGEYEISSYAEKERYAENVMISEIEHALFKGKILGKLS
ncbi:MAG: hypothetical protein HY880_09705 [Deltaproteobacteria bacterium]|nr:hypothetical protein [Deltaproteobacteria bacterium]